MYGFNRYKTEVSVYVMSGSVEMPCNRKVKFFVNTADVLVKTYPEAVLRLTNIRDLAFQACDNVNNTH